jgi:predicted nucleic acid-binding protein
MSYYLLDSSALVKRYMPETGTIWLRQLVKPDAGKVIVIASITGVETMSAISRHYHDGNISLDTLQLFRQQLEYHIQTQYNVLDLSQSILTRAMHLNEKHRLRAYDSVQLSSALELHQRAIRMSVPMNFIAADKRLLEAAQLEGLTTDNPNHYDS